MQPAALRAGAKLDNRRMPICKAPPNSIPVVTRHLPEKHKELIRKHNVGEVLNLMSEMHPRRDAQTKIGLTPRYARPARFAARRLAALDRGRAVWGLEVTAGFDPIELELRCGDVEQLHVLTVPLHSSSAGRMNLTTA